MQRSLAEYKLAKTPNLFAVQFQELLRIVRIIWETYRFNSQEFFTFTCIHRLSTRNRIPPPLVFHRPFSTVECSLGYKPYLFSLLERNYESLPRSHNNKKRGGLGRVSATGMYRSIEHLKFPKFQTGIFVEWKAPRVLDPSLPRTSNRWRSRDKSFASRLRFTTCVFNVGWFSRMSFTWKLLAYNSCFIPCNDTKILWTKS